VVTEELETYYRYTEQNSSACKYMARRLVVVGSYPSRTNEIHSVLPVTWLMSATTPCTIPSPSAI